MKYKVKVKMVYSDVVHVESYDVLDATQDALRSCSCKLESVNAEVMNDDEDDE